MINMIDNFLERYQDHIIEIQLRKAMENQSEILIYSTGDGKTKLQVRIDDQR